MSYAIHAVLLLDRAPPGVPISCSQLATKGNMPERFLLQILRILVNSGMLESVRGADGGYVLARDSRAISLLDLFEALDDPLVTKTSPIEGIPLLSRRSIARAMKRVSTAARRELGRASIAQIARGEKRRAPT
jgi:Rrf2 family protein